MLRFNAQALKEEVDAVSKDVERAERSYDLNRAAELKCAEHPRLALPLNI